MAEGDQRALRDRIEQLQGELARMRGERDALQMVRDERDRLARRLEWYAAQPESASVTALLEQRDTLQSRLAQIENSRRGSTMGEGLRAVLLCLVLIGGFWVLAQWFDHGR